MLRFLMPFLLVFFCLLGDVWAEQQTVKASWMLKSPPTAKTDAEVVKGSVHVPLLVSDGCKKNYRIDELFLHGDATDEKRVRQALLGQGSVSDLQITITKLFAGRAELPTLVIHDKDGKSHRLTFDGSVDYNKWPSKGYQIKATFSAGSISLPKFWNKVELLCDSPDYPKMADRKPENIATSKTPSEQGRELHLRILRKHPKIDRFYEKPMLSGELTDNPLVVINVPAKDWASISEKDRDLLCKYVASLVTKVRSSPFSYTTIPENAPIASRVKQNISKMTDRSWGIRVGRISEDGRDIYSDKVVKTGQ